jgi:hypothetical protein
MKQSAQESQTLFSSILNLFITGYDIIPSGAENLKLNGVTYTPRQFIKKFMDGEDEISKGVGVSEFYDVISLIKKAKKMSHERAVDYVASQVFKVLQEGLKGQELKKISDLGPGVSKLLESKFDYTGYLPVLDITSDRQLMVNTLTGQVQRELSYDSWKRWVFTREPEEKKILNTTCTPAIIDYLPQVKEEISFCEAYGQKEVFRLNAHIMPEWRKEPKAEGITMPPLFKEFMEHLFPEENSRYYVYCWMKNMLLDRNFCILLLYGVQGTGKGTLAYLMKELVGDSNYAQVGDDYWDSRFTSELEYRRCVSFDDNELDTKNAVKIRSMTNLTIRVEAKGRDAREITNYASYIWSTNPDRKCLITCDDRRYSVPIMASQDIQKAKGAPWMDTLVENILHNNEFIKEVGQWLLHCVDTSRFNMKQPLLTSSFYDLVQRNLTQWQRYIVELICSKENDVYPLMDAEGPVPGLKGTGRTKVQNFLEGYKDEDGEQIGFLKQLPSGDRVISASEKYYPDDIKEILKNNNEFNDMEF